MSKVTGDHLRRLREASGLSQADLARRAGLSRQALLAVEQGRVPRADTALRLAQALHTSVEALFSRDAGTPARWVGRPTRRARWAMVQGLVLYPGHDLRADVEIRADEVLPLPEARPAERVVTIAGCDPALPLIAQWFEQLNPGWWCDTLDVPSADALDLLSQGLVHVAGSHLAQTRDHGSEARPLTSRRLQAYRAISWEAGIAASLPRDLEGWAEHWTRGTFLTRQQGAGARLLAERQAARLGLSIPPAGQLQEAQSHWEAAERVARGKAPVGVMTRAVAEQFGLLFTPWIVEPFDWVVNVNPEEPAARLLAVLRQPAVRRSLERIPGYDGSQAGEPAWSQ